MKLVFENIFIIAVIVIPLVLLETLRSHSQWIEKNHGWLSGLIWFIALCVVYFWLLPRLGLGPNDEFFDMQN